MNVDLSATAELGDGITIVVTKYKDVPPPSPPVGFRLVGTEIAPGGVVRRFYYEAVVT